MLTFKKHLDPLVGRLDTISNFSDIKGLNDLQQQEYPYLQNLIGLTSSKVSYLIKRLEKLEIEMERQIQVIDSETGDDKTAAVKVYNRMLKDAEDLVSRINRELAITNSPYFGKIVFNRAREASLPAAEITSYIGKFAYSDEETRKPLITDWRAPIANLYYTNPGPEKGVSFESPAGKQTGDLTQKRQFEISLGRIDHIYDSQSGNVTADEFLLAQLNKRLGKRLADIVATIQDQQNGIIREEKDKMAILQGVAGSGKTTIVLHRLAYLIFTYPETIKTENCLIIAPNKMFLDYISEVLPSLGVYGVEANTYLFWAKKILKWDDTYILSSTENLQAKAFKGSVDFLRIIKEHLETYEEKILEKLPYSRKDSVRTRYFELKESFPQISVLERMQLALERATLEKQFEKKVTGSFMGIHTIDDALKTKIDAYIKRSFNPIKIYKSLFASKEFKIPSEIKKYTRSLLVRALGKTIYTIEDLAPLVYIYFWLNGTTENQKEYIVADEAQDMSPMQILTLFMTAKRSNLFIAGDLAQSINPPFYIQNWDELKVMLKNVAPGTDFSYHEISKCYRTTVEIIDFANKVLRKQFKGKYGLPEAVLRHGKPVEKIRTGSEVASGERSTTSEILRLAQQQFDHGSATVALLCRDEAHTNAVYEALSKQATKMSFRIINSDENNYDTGLLVLPINRAKGLEFDSVFIMDLNENRYKDEQLDARLLYVGLTRALHRLFIVQSGNINDSKLLDE